jgi:hypothetical protein
LGAFNQGNHDYLCAARKAALTAAMTDEAYWSKSISHNQPKVQNS